MTSRVRNVFTALAEQLQIPTAEIELLDQLGMTTADEFFFRLPEQSKMEEWLGDTIRMKTCTQHEVEPGVMEWRIIDRLDGETNLLIPEVTFSRSGLAAAMRRLWAASKAAAQRDMAKATDEAQFGVATKVNSAVLADLASRSLDRGGMYVDEHERPGQAAVSIVMNNFKHSGPWAYIPWEAFVSEEEESHQRRLRGEKKCKIRMELTAEGSLEGITDDAEIRRSKVHDLLAMQDCLMVRAVTHEWLQIVDFSCYSRMTRIYVAKFRKRQPQQMRGPTLGEIRQTDRLLHEEVLHYASRGSGTLQQGLNWHLDNESRIWKLLDGTTDDTPDQSLESAKRMRPSLSSADDATQMARCYVCGRTRREHANHAFCRPDPPPAGRQPDHFSGKGGKKGKFSRQQPKGLGKDKGKPKGRGKQRDSTPSFLAGCASRTPPTAEFPSGQAFCWAYHNPNQQGCTGSCGRSHMCPRFENNHVCLQAHPVYRH